MSGQLYVQNSGMEPTIDNYYGGYYAAYGMVLRKSQYAGTASFEMASSLVNHNRTFDPNDYRAQLVDLIIQAASIETGEE